VKKRRQVIFVIWSGNTIIRQSSGFIFSEAIHTPPLNSLFPGTYALTLGDLFREYDHHECINKSSRKLNYLFKRIFWCLFYLPQIKMALYLKLTVIRNDKFLLVTEDLKIQLQLEKYKRKYFYKLDTLMHPSLSPLR